MSGLTRVGDGFAPFAKKQQKKQLQKTPDGFLILHTFSTN
jgi:hypothetical protein